MTEATNPPVQVVKIIGKKIWCESDILGARHVMVQHDMEGEQPFCYATFHYSYMHTCNSGTRAAAEDMARSLGATGEIEWRNRPIGDTFK